MIHVPWCEFTKMSDKNSEFYNFEILIEITMSGSLTFLHFLVQFLTFFTLTKSFSDRQIFWHFHPLLESLKNFWHFHRSGRKWPTIKLSRRNLAGLLRSFKIPLTNLGSLDVKILSPATLLSSRQLSTSIGLSAPLFDGLIWSGSIRFGVTSKLNLAEVNHLSPDL